MAILDYLNLITSAWRQKPKYTETISVDVSPMVEVQNLLSSLTEKYDLETAVGQQLDVIGEWVGITRNVDVPISGVYFSWDDTLETGWDYGVWQPSLEPNTITTLDDDTYRILIKAKIAANNWDGTTNGAYAIWDDIFTEFTILIQDHQNMSYDIAFVGGIIDSLTLALIVGGYIPLKPEGVRVNSYFVPIDAGPVFSWDLETALLGGWDESSWAREFSGS